MPDGLAAKSVLPQVTSVSPVTQALIFVRGYSDDLYITDNTMANGVFEHAKGKGAGTNGRRIFDRRPILFMLKGIR